MGSRECAERCVNKQMIADDSKARCRGSKCVATKKSERRRNKMNAGEESKSKDQIMQPLATASWKPFSQ